MIIAIAVTGLTVPIMGIANVPDRGKGSDKLVAAFGSVDNALTVGVTRIADNYELESLRNKEGNVSFIQINTFFGSKKYELTGGQIPAGRMCSESFDFLPNCVIGNSHLCELGVNKSDPLSAFLPSFLQAELGDEFLSKREKMKLTEYLNGWSLSDILEMDIDHYWLLGRWRDINKLRVVFVYDHIRSLFDKEKRLGVFGSILGGNGGRLSSLSSDRHLLQLSTSNPGISEDCQERGESDCGREQRDSQKNPIGWGLDKQWRGWACAGILALIPFFGAAAFGLIYSAVHIPKMSIFNVFKIGIAFILIAVAGVMVHVSLDLFYFGQVYLEHLL